MMKMNKKFINYMNESNDSFEKVIESKKLTIYAKIVSIKIFNIFFV